MSKTSKKHASKNDTTKMGSNSSSNRTGKVRNFFKKHKVKIIIGTIIVVVATGLAIAIPIISHNIYVESELNKDYWLNFDKEKVETDCQLEIERNSTYTSYYCTSSEKLTGTYSNYDKVYLDSSRSGRPETDGEKFTLTIKHYLFSQSSIPEKIDDEVSYTDSFYMRNYNIEGRGVFSKDIPIKFRMTNEVKKTLKEERERYIAEQEAKKTEEERKKAEEEEKRKAEEEKKKADEEEQKTSNNTEQKTPEEKPKEETKPTETTTTITGKDHDANDMAGKFSTITNVCLDRVDVHYPGAYPLDSDDGYPVYFSITVKNDGTLVEGAMNGYIRTKYGQKILSYHCIYKDGTAKIKELE